MSRPAAILKIGLFSFAVWACTLLLYFVGVAMAAAGLQRASTGAASWAVVILLVLEAAAACLAIAFVFIRSRAYFETTGRVAWTIGFALLQFGACAVAALTTLFA
ncbi:MAG: hypothetical protein FJ011_24695, partial [Chloroflexi bacterium]|nr:hypothetical protein [Chloroflexota bacterium]